MDKLNEATSLFKSGLNCGQSILGTYGPLYGMDKSVALRASLGLGGGMGGRGGGICGAVSGSVIVIGLKTGMAKEPSDRETKYKTYAKVQQYFEKFKKLHGSIVCCELLGCDISTDEGLSKARENGLFKTLCPDFVRDAAKILEEVLNDD